MSTLFIADLHLEDARPGTTDAFLRFLRDEARYTNEDIARASGYGLDTVKGWFSDNANRQRVVKDRALQLIMANLNITPQAYLLAVNRQD